MDDNRRALHKLLAEQLGLPLSEQELEKSLEEFSVQLEAQDAWAREKWPDGIADCADCPVNCHTFHLSDDARSCELFGMTLRRKERAV